MANYSELLNTKSWKDRRFEILSRDKFLCQNCHNEKILKDCDEALGTKMERHPNNFNFRLTIGEFYLDAFISDECKSKIPNSTNVLYDRVNGHVKVLAFMDMLTNDFIYVSGLHVHHKYYQEDLNPWEYPDEALITYCWLCHEELHSKIQVPKLDNNGNEIGSMTPCHRCGGAGIFPEFRHIKAGFCFHCNGARYEELL